jgi:hypothetical protein
MNVKKKNVLKRTGAADCIRRKIIADTIRDTQKKPPQKFQGDFFTQY